MTSPTLRLAFFAADRSSMSLVSPKESIFKPFRSFRENWTPMYPLFVFVSSDSAPYNLRAPTLRTPTPRASVSGPTDATQLPTNDSDPTTANVTGGGSASIFRRARSDFRSYPTYLASYSDPSRNRTLTGSL